MTPRLLLDRSGSSAAEFALVLTPLLILLFGIIDSARFAWEYNQAEKATQVGVRMAVVTNVVSTGLATQNYVGVGGLTQGDLIPTSALSPIVCTREACTCTGSCPTGFETADDVAFDAIVTRMKTMKPDITAANVRIEYSGSGLGYAGDPNGMDIAPLVGVRLVNMQFVPITSFKVAKFTMPEVFSTLTAEDSSGTTSN